MKLPHGVTVRLEPVYRGECIEILAEVTARASFLYQVGLDPETLLTRISDVIDSAIQKAHDVGKDSP